MGMAKKILGYFVSIVILIIGILLVIGAMQVTIFHGIFMLILGLAVIVGGGLLMRAAYRHDVKQQQEEISARFDSYCSKCGNRVDEESVFCSRCGNQLNRGEEPTDKRSPL